jgi:NAD(P)-dependent dehydrogenase (short-subunit alcohol dehydrogenase family)
MNPSEFQGKVALVTGAGRGTGRDVSESLAALGAIVAANDITPINLDETMRRITSIGGRGKDYVCDISKKMALQTMLNQILDDWGRIDILINHANVRPRASILEMDEWDWRRTLEVNLTGPFLCMQAVGRVMREQGGGVMVNIGSTLDDSSDLQERSAYTACMAGLAQLTREAARELAACNIRLNLVCLGEESLTPDIVLADLGYPQSLLGYTLYLCSQSAAHLNGQVLTVTVESSR